MATPRSIGFPRMMKEQGEKRVFLPEFIQCLTRLGVNVYIEEGYGSRSGFTFDDFHQANSSVQMCSREEAFQQDVVLVLRSPSREELKLFRPGTILVSMLHYPTRPKRVETLEKLDIWAISLDSIVNDMGLRLVENMKAVAWNGLEVAFDELEKCCPGMIEPDCEPVRVLILGAGMVGKHAVDAATKMGNIERNNLYMQKKGPGVVATTIGRNMSRNPRLMEQMLRQTDILVDATQRRDTSQPVICNDWLAWLPAHAIITDLAVDPYSVEVKPPVVRGVEGIPQGDLNQYVFYPGDPNWDKTVPTHIPSQHRRTVVSCYSWPGIHPEACMRHYAQQIEPLAEVLIRMGYEEISPEGGYFERALDRATLRSWIRAGQYRTRPR